MQYQTRSFVVYEHHSKECNVLFVLYTYKEDVHTYYQFNPVCMNIILVL